MYDKDAEAVKTEGLANPSLYELTHPRLMRAQQQLEDHHHRLQQVTSTIVEPTTSLSPSLTTMGDLHQPGSSKFT